MNKVSIDELLQLPEDERRQIAHVLLDSLEGDELPLTEEQIAECKRRLAEHERHPERAIPWEVVRDRLWSRYK